jgi:CRP-like cAMP-binding protein
MSLDRQTLDAMVAFAKNSKLLTLLDRAGLSRLAEHGMVQDVSADTVIVTQGEPGSTFYLLSSGEVSVRVREANNKEVARLTAGTFFGEIAVVTRQPRSATVVAVTPSRLLSFPRAPLMDLIRDYPQLREVIGTAALARAEENLRQALADDDRGLAESLEGEEEPVSLEAALEDPGAADLAVEEPPADDGVEVDLADSAPEPPGSSGGKGT